MAKDYKVYYKKVEGKTPTSYTMDHTAGSYVFDTQGRVRLFTRYGAPANGLRAESGAVRVLPTHYDNFFQPMQKGLAFMPGTDLRAPRVFFEPLPWLVLDYDERITLPPDEP